jgi:hypothetical protein
MKMPKGSKTTNPNKLTHRENLECLVDKKLGLAAQLATLGWSDIKEQDDALEWYAQKWQINITELKRYDLLAAARDKESTLNKKRIARKQKCKRRTRRPLTKKRK